MLSCINGRLVRWAFFFSFIQAHPFVNRVKPTPIIFTSLCFNHPCYITITNNSFSEHSYFLPGVEVRIICRFSAASSKTREIITFSANRTTNELGLYKLDITSVEGVPCASDKDSLIASCQASLISSSSYSCNVPGYKTTTDQVVFKSKRSNLCVYGFIALNFRPFKKDFDLCGKQ